MLKEINRLALNAGQWVRFEPGKQRREIPKELGKDHHFLVVQRSDDFMDPGFCHLIDISGKKYSYSARTFELGYASFIGTPSTLSLAAWQAKVLEIPLETVKQAHGVQQVMKVYRAAKLSMPAGDEAYLSSSSSEPIWAWSSDSS